MSFIYKFQHNAHWILVFNHVTTKPDPWFNKSNVLYSLEDGKYSILSLLEKYRINGHFEFLLEYPELTGYNRWIQISNPIETTEVVGYSPVGTLSWTKYGWTGLVLSSVQTHCLIDGTTLNDLWFYAIGQYKAWSYGSIAGPYHYQDANYYITKVSLWCRLPYLSTEGLTNQYIMKVILYAIFNVKT